VHPAGLVPVLVLEGHPIYESHDILRWAAAHARTPDRLTPADPAARAEMDQWIDGSSLVGDDPTQALEASAGNCAPGLTVPLFAAMIRDIPAWRIVEGLLFHRLKMRPLLFLALKASGLARVGAIPPVRRIVVASRRAMARHLDDLEAQLTARGGPWILGRDFSLADVSWAMILERLREADRLGELVTPRPRVAAYWAVLRERPSYAAAMAAHEHPLVRTGRARIAAEKHRPGSGLGACTFSRTARARACRGTAPRAVGRRRRDPSRRSATRARSPRCHPGHRRSRRRRGLLPRRPRRRRVGWGCPSPR